MDCKGGDSAGIGVVNGAKMRMQPLIVSTGRSKHGSTDPGSEWAQSRYRWVLQLVLRLIKAGCNIELPSDLPTPLPTGVDVPDCFNPDNLSPLDVYRTAFWDETHKKVSNAPHRAAPRRAARNCVIICTIICIIIIIHYARPPSPRARGGG